MFGSEVKYQNAVNSWGSEGVGGVITVSDTRVVVLLEGVQTLDIVGEVASVDVVGVRGGHSMSTCVRTAAGSIFRMTGSSSGSPMEEEEAMHSSLFRKQDAQWREAGNLIATVVGGGVRFPGTASLTGGGQSITGNFRAAREVL